MSEMLGLLLALLAGAVLGGLFFGGLWWSVRRSLASAQPALWLFASLLIRTLVTLGGFYLLAQSGWQALLAALIGFIGARMLVTRLSPSPTPSLARGVEGRAS